MARNGILEFLEALDAELAKHAQERQWLDLYLLGRASLIVRYGLTLATKDADVTCPW
jgi:hypothetical protein